MILKKYILEILITFGVITLIYYSPEAIIYKDSARYLKTNIVDPPLYPFLISIMQSIFNTLNSVVILQTVILGISIVYISKTLAAYFELENLTKIFISIFLLTEAIAYAFSLFFVSFALKTIYDFKLQNLTLLTTSIILLLLTRNQFMFIYPVILVLYIGIIFLHREKKKFIWLILSFVSIIFLHNFLISLNKSILNFSSQNNISKNNDINYLNYQERENYLGPFYYIYADAMYISNVNDAELFKNKNLKRTLIKLFVKIDNEKASLKYYDGRGHFGLSLNKIITISEHYLINLANKENTSIVNLKKEISIKLIQANFKKYLKNLFKKFYDSTWLFVFVPFFIFLPSLFCFLKFKSKISLFLIFLSSFTLANHSVIYLFGRVQPRYLIYTDFILLIFIFIFFKIFLEKKFNRHKY